MHLNTVLVLVTEISILYVVCHGTTIAATGKPEMTTGVSQSIITKQTTLTTKVKAPVGKEGRPSADKTSTSKIPLSTNPGMKSTSAPIITVVKAKSIPSNAVVNGEKADQTQSKLSSALKRGKRDSVSKKNDKVCLKPLTKGEAEEVLKPYDIDDGEFCKGDDFHCNETNTCVSYLMFCDGVEDCPSGDDEEHCKEFKCGDNLTNVNSDLICNGCFDCLDGSDEVDCEKKPEKFCMNYESCFLCDDGSLSCQ